LACGCPSRRDIAYERNDKGDVVRMSVTDHGTDWLASKQAEAS
jgi:hypothetical protein